MAVLTLGMKFRILAGAAPSIFPGFSACQVREAPSVEIISDSLCSAIAFFWCLVKREKWEKIQIGHGHQQKLKVREPIKRLRCPPISSASVNYVKGSLLEIALKIDGNWRKFSGLFLEFFLLKFFLKKKINELNGKIDSFVCINSFIKMQM